MKREALSGCRYFLGGTEAPRATAVVAALEEAGARKMAGCVSGEIADHEDALRAADFAVLCLGGNWHMRDLEALSRRSVENGRPVVVVDSGVGAGVVELAGRLIPGCVVGDGGSFGWVESLDEALDRCRTRDSALPADDRASGWRSRSGPAEGAALGGAANEAEAGAGDPGDAVATRLEGREILLEFLRRFASASSAEFEKLGAWLVEAVAGFLRADSAGFAFRRGGVRGREFVRCEWSRDPREGGRAPSVAFCSLLEPAMRPGGTSVVAAHDRPDDTGRGLARVRGAQSVLAVVLRPDGTEGGYFVVDSRDRFRDWSAEDVEFAERLGEVLAGVAERLNAIEARDEMSSRLARARRIEAIGQLSGGLAHDFNNVLQPILGFCELLAQRLEPGDPILGDLSEIRRSAERAGFLTRQMLTFSRKQVISRRLEAVHPLIDEVCAGLREEAGGACRLFVDLGAGAPRAMLDAAQFRQLLANLVTNAIEAMPLGGTITVRTRLATLEEARQRLPHEMRNDAGRFLCLEVLDEGPGIDPDMRDKVFEPFFSTKGKEGAGLGLSVAYGIAEQHGGWITVGNAPLRGGVVRVFLPIAADSMAANATAGTPPRPAAQRTGGSGQVPARILVVEDEPAVLRFLTTALTQAGYEVVAAAGFREGLEAFERERDTIDMIFSDAVLPDGNGVDLIDRLLAENPALKALLSSGYTDKERLLEVAGRREITFLQKPYSLPVLFSTVRAVLAREDCAILG